MIITISLSLEFQFQSQCSFVFAVSLLWLPVQAITLLTRGRDIPNSESPLAETSLLLLLVLVHQPPAPGHDNPFCTAINHLKVSYTWKEKKEKFGLSLVPVSCTHTVQSHSLLQCLSVSPSVEICDSYQSSAVLLFQHMCKSVSDRETPSHSISLLCKQMCP